MIFFCEPVEFPALVNWSSFSPLLIFNHNLIIVFF
nr:MAG TPA: hypothetical protein [Caudoviricetes sp.]